MRRRAGIGAIQKKNLEQEKYKDKGSQIQVNELERMTNEMEVFKAKLEEFASKHKSVIKSDPQFRKQFQEMCARFGVDPLTSVKGFWSVLGIGDYYYELAVKIIEICLATNSKNGGLISASELLMKLDRLRRVEKKRQKVTADDLLRAAKKLKVLGRGFTVIPVTGDEFLVQSVPIELSMDHTSVLSLLTRLDMPGVTVEILMKYLQWERERAQKVLDDMIKLGFAWIDTQEYQMGGVSYAFPSLFDNCMTAD